MELRRPHEPTTGHSSDPRRSTQLGASRLRPPSTTRQGPNDRRARALSSREECVTPPPPVPVLRVLEACRGERTEGPLVLRPLSGQPVDRRDWYRICLLYTSDAADDLL